MEDGLSQAMISSQIQDRRGFMWFGTQDGLNRWDGHEMKVYKHQPFDTTTLASQWVNDLDEDSEGNIWVASFGGLSKLNPITDQVESWRYDAEDPSSLPSELLSSILIATDGTVWIGTQGDGLISMRLDEPGVFTQFMPVEGDSTSLSFPFVWGITEDSEGRVWVGTQVGINRVEDGDAGVFTRFLAHDFGFDCQYPQSRPGTKGAGSFVERPEEPGIGWLSHEVGLGRFDLDTGEIQFFKYSDRGPCSGTFTPVQDPINPSVLWVGAGDGLARFDIRQEAFQVFTYESDKPGSLPAGFTENVFVDRSGIIWVGTNPAGVSYFDPASVGVGLYTETEGDPTSLHGRSVTSVAQGADGVVWVAGRGPNGWGMTELDRGANTARHYRHDPNDPTSLQPGDYWSSIAVAPDGDVWVGSEAPGVSRLDRSTGQFQHFRPDPNDPNSFRQGDRATFMLVDRTGTMWIAGRGGVSRMEFDRPGVFQHYLGDPDDEETVWPGLARSLTEDRAGFIWIAQQGGAARLDPVTGRVRRWGHDPDDPGTLAAPTVAHVNERRVEPGVVWIGMYGGGVDRLDVESGEIRHYTEREGLANNGVYAVLDDDQGRLWISTNGGISRFDPDTETFRNYGTEIGLQGLEFNSGAFHRGPQGELFFGGQHGLNSFFPNELNENSTPPEVTLVDLKLFNESVAYTGAVELDGSLDQTDQITLTHDQRDLEFDFVAFHFADPESNEYAYKLEGWNDDWVYAGGKRTASFTNLDPGEYTFRVRAANSDGVWNEDGASIRVVVTPPFWATWWFRVLALGIFAGVVVGGYRLRTAQLASRARELEGQVNVRTAELRSSNEQLEQSQSIVQAINQETSFRRLLTRILDESRVIPGVEKATAIVYMPEEGVFRVRASSGWDVDAMSGITLTDRQARKRYVGGSQEVAKDIFVAKNVGEREGSEEMAEFGKVASFMVLRITVEEEVAAYLVFDNLTNTDAFEERDVAFLERLREHIQSAFNKTRILEDLEHTLDDLRSTQDRLVQTEKMASLGELTAGIAHEIKNPLNFVNNFAELASELAEEAKSAESPERLAEILDEIKSSAERIDHHAKRADGIVENMMQHATGSGGMEPTDVNALLDEYATLAYHGARAKHPNFEVEVERNYDPAIRKLEIVPQEMGKVLLNLLTNAFDALREHGTAEPHVKPTVSVSTERSNGQVEIRVRDNGPGIPEDVKAKIFEPFFTTKPTGSGTGLGLSMSYDIVTKGHGGELEVDSSPGQGATFVVRLPA